MLLIARHGETELNKLDCYQGKIHSELTEKGIAQAKALGDLLSTFSLNTFSIHVSPSVRVLNTIKIAFGDKYKIHISSLLNEQNYGLWEGLSKKEIQNSFSEQWKLFKSKGKYYIPPYGESFEQAKLRAAEWLHFNFQQNPNKNFLVVTHKKISMGLRETLYSSWGGLDHPHENLFSIDLLENKMKRYNIYTQICDSISSMTDNINQE